MAVQATIESPLFPQSSWLSAMSETWWAVQSAQWQALTAWQQAVTSMQQELWDEWTARWAGGAPID
jgi:hypothetical protein